MKSDPFATAVILAGGSGTRMGEAIDDKILHPVNGKPLIQYCLEAFARCETVDSLVLVYRDEGQRDTLKPLVTSGEFSNVSWAEGGARRQDSVWAGLSAIQSPRPVVLIHDGARPLISAQTIDQAAAAAREHGAACVARKVVDTLKQVSSVSDGYQLETLDRDALRAMETPQAFQYPLFRDAYQRIIESGQIITDDLSAIEDQRSPVQLVENPMPNPKLTQPQDLPWFEYLIQNRAQ